MSRSYRHIRHHKEKNPYDNEYIHFYNLIKSRLRHPVVPKSTDK